MLDALKKNRGYALFALACAALGVLLRYRSLSSGFAVDDYAQLAMLDGHYPVKRAAWDLYNFSNGTLEENNVIRHAGFFPWFTHPEIRLSMLRPLSSLLLALEYHVWGNDPFPYHVHSALLWVGMLFALAVLYAALLPRAVAAIALVFFAVDESHTMPFGWIANRCSLGSTLFGILGLLAYLRFRERGRTAAAVACVAAFSISLGYGEYGLCFSAYVAAYELWRFLQARATGQHGTTGFAALRSHALAMWPVFVPCLIYLAARRILEHGVLHSGTYIGPDGDLKVFLWNAVQRAPVLFADLFVDVPSSLWNLGNFTLGSLHQRGWVSMRWLLTPGPWRLAHAIVGAVAMVAGLVAWRIVTRQLDRDVAEGTREPMPHLRWLAWGSVLSIVPVLGSFPSARLLIIAEIGMAAVLASIVVLCLRDVRRRFQHKRTRTVLVATVGVLVFALHSAWAARTSYADSIHVKYMAVAVRTAVLTIDADRKRLPKQRLVVLAAFGYDTSIYLSMILRRHGAKPPRSSWVLSLVPGPHVLFRDSPTSFMLAPADGFVMLANSPEELFSDPLRPFKPGDVVDLGGMKITVLQTTGQYIQAIRVETDVPLDDPSLWFVFPRDTGIERFVMPAVGELALLPAPVIPPL